MTPVALGAIQLWPLYHHRNLNKLVLSDNSQLHVPGYSLHHEQSASASFQGW